MSATVKNLFWVYSTLAALTLIFQIYVRVPQCTDNAECAVSLGKGVVWSAIWLASSVVYLG
jgi:hypothetical protein